jgi:hypothetical protein
MASLQHHCKGRGRSRPFDIFQTHTSAQARLPQYKETTMGNHVSKTPFDLTDFLSKKGTPKPSRFRSNSPTKPHLPQTEAVVEKSEPEVTTPKPATE